MKLKRFKLPGTHIGAISLKYTKDVPSRFFLSGIDDLDTFTGGFPSGEMTIVAARPGSGKTALAMQIAEHIAKTPPTGEAVGVFSIEMTGKSLVTRMILADTGLPSIPLRKNELTEKQRKTRDKSLARLAKLPIYIDDSSNATIKHVEKIALAWIRAGIKFLVLDYVQLMTPGRLNRGGDTRANFVGEVARALKRIAKQNDISFVVLSQLNRNSATGNRRPTAADLKESGDLEQVADNIILIHPDKANPPHVDLIIEKWRNGPTGTVSVHFDSERTRFQSLHVEE